jgi:hypothetical protein
MPGAKHRFASELDADSKSSIGELCGDFTPRSGAMLLPGGAEGFIAEKHSPAERLRALFFLAAEAA